VAAQGRTRRRSARQSVTIIDVAKRAGVSTATVSRALAKPEVVSPQARARVQEAIEEIGFTPNFAARNLRARRTMTVLVVVPNIANPFFAQILRGIDDALVAAGYGMIIGNLDNLAEREARYVDIVFAGQVDGVLLMSGRIPSAQGRLMTEAGVPMATICVRIAGTRLPHVVVNDRTAARAVVEHLFGLGHRRFGFISGPAGNINSEDRLLGFREALAAARLDPDRATYWAGDFMLGSGVRAAEQFLAARRRPTAVFAASDHMAISFMKTVRAAGVRVPDDVSVVGFDGIEFADFVEPTLTTVRQPRYELGRTGARVLLEAMRSEPTPPGIVELEAPLIVRDSTAPPSPRHDRDRER
jgi:LacI family transcriptional regulator, repressor for deo operon, udp, cdd, tsx, nupC, and nupG